MAVLSGKKPLLLRKMFITRYSQTQFSIQDSKKSPKVKIALGDFLNEPVLSSSPDIVLVAQNQGKPKGFEKISSQPFLINAPGEYEVKGVAIQGIQNNGQVIYILQLGSEKLAYLFKPAQKELSPAQMDRLEEVKFLIISLDGQGLGPDKAASLISQIEPQLVIPMDYQPSHLKRLAEIMGLKEVIEEESLSTDKLPLIKEETSLRALNITS